MNYGVSSVWLDFAQIVWVKTLSFFCIPGSKTPREVVSAVFQLPFLLGLKLY